jgi:hypothetical protein
MHIRTLLLCAFILWAAYTPQRNIGRAPDRYEAIEAYATLDYCLLVRQATKLNPPFVRAVCLPDTVNPNQS